MGALRAAPRLPTDPVSCSFVAVDRTDAEKSAARLQAEHVDRSTHRFIARQKPDGSWSVVKVLVPAEVRKAPVKLTAEHEPPRPFAADVRSAHETRIPGLPGGLG